MSNRSRSALAGVLLATIAVGSSAHASAPRDLRREVLDAARAHGVDAAPLLAREVPLPGGTTTLGELLDVAGGPHASGIGGTPETLVGDVWHFAYSVGGVDIPAVYRVTHSAITPETPAAAAGIPGTPATTGHTLTEYGGPLRQVKTNAYTFGVHIAGGGSTNVDTSSAGDPIFVSGLNGGLVSDTAMDFTGHGTVTNQRSCIFDFCLAFGFVVGDGVAIFGNETIADTVPRPETLTIP